MATPDLPDARRRFLVEHTALILRSYRHWTGRDLVEPGLDGEAMAHALYHLDFAILSHDCGADPCFTYANLTAQRIFERAWDEFIGTPSRFSAEPLARVERDQLLARVSTHGFVDDYRGVRVTRSGKRFQVQDAAVWNLLDEGHRVCGQAACLREWHFAPRP